MVGVQRDHEYRAEATMVMPGSTLYLFSDGVFEIETAKGEQRELDDLLPLLLAPATAASSEPERLVGEVRRLTSRGVFEDDLTLLVVTFE